MFEWTSGNRYEGAFVKDKRSGKGTFFWTDGETFSGQFVNDKRTGFGVYHYATGDLYKGMFEQGIKSGQGQYFYSNGGEQIPRVVDDSHELVQMCLKACMRKSNSTW